MLQDAIARPAGHCGRFDPCRRRGPIIEAHRAPAHEFSGLADADRAAPSGARPGSCRDRGGRRLARRCCARAANCLNGDTEIYVADTVGELGLIYRLAPAVFMGGSLVKHGGQNPIEAAKLGAAILHGPHVWNFAEIYAALDNAHGAERSTSIGPPHRTFCGLAQRPGRARPRRRRRRMPWSRTWAARSTARCASLDPYLMQLQLRQRAPPCVNRPSGGARPASSRGLLAPLGLIYGAIAARRMAAKARSPECR